MMRAVWVKWRDAAGSNTWHDKSDFREFCSAELSECDSVGLLAHEDDRKIVLIQTAGSNQVTGLFEIPKSCVVKIETLATLGVRLELD